ncbi:MAG: alpha/beta hydrolase [Kovacikia sp.]
MRTSLLSHLPSLPRQCLKQLGLVGVGFLSVLFTTVPTKAAETISFVYSPFQTSLSVQSLDEFARTGRVKPDLDFLFRLARVSEAAKAELRQALVERTAIDPLLPSRFFYSDVGEDVLNHMGRYIAIPPGLNGKSALRSALILSALDPQGLTLLNFLHKYPTRVVWIDVRELLVLPKVINQVVGATTYFTNQVRQEMAQESASSTPVNFSQLPDLRQSGSFGVEQQRWQLTDASRNRPLYVDVYRPQRWREGKTPVVIFSHGLGSRPEDFADRAKHLASYGYVVTLPQHPGSDYQQAQNLKRGLSQQVFLTSEFIDRPRDISFVIDELERRNATEFEGRLNLQSVGVSGHSFGGYTALAVAGATIDFDFLKQECDRLLYPNTSLLLQCRALNLPRQTYHFRDPRVAAVVVANPVNYSIFGPKGLAQIQIPVLIGSGTYDPATPAVIEQARSFPALTTRNKYLAVAEGQAHVDISQLDAGATQMLRSIVGLTLPTPDLIYGYANSLTVAFFEVHLVGNPDYHPYLQSGYAHYLSQNQRFKLFLITAASDPALKRAIGEWLSKNPPVQLPEDSPVKAPD